jgi:hypothetical protein
VVETVVYEVDDFALRFRISSLQEVLQMTGGYFPRVIAKNEIFVGFLKLDHGVRRRSAAL